jgi:diacylglycerol O-acyltransferase / wax synthase
MPVMKPLAELDALFLQLETPQMPMHVGALNVYELPAGLRGDWADALKQHIRERLPALAPLRRRLWFMPLNLANPVWVDAEPDLDWHVCTHRVSADAGMAGLEDLVARLHPQLLDRARPLWRFHVIEGFDSGLPGRRWVALYSQLHHAAVDGQAAVALAQVLLDVAPQPRPFEARASRRPHRYRLGVAEMLRTALLLEARQVAGGLRDLPATLGTLRGALKQMLVARNAVSNLTLAPRTPFNRTVGEARSFAVVTVALQELKALGQRHGATLNDMVLVLCSGALRRWLLAHGALPKKSLVAGVPISLREAGDTRAQNQVSMSLVSLGTHLADVRRRVLHVLAASQAMKSSMGSVKSILPTDVPSIGVPWLVQAAAALYGGARLADRLPQVSNLVISNVPGPPVPLYLAGARMLCNYPTSIVVHGVGLNITVESYAGQLDFGLMADRGAMPDARELAAALMAELDELRALNHRLAGRVAPARPPSTGVVTPEAGAAQD